MDKIEEPAREGFLYFLWVERQFAPNTLRTIDGRTVEIIEKGERNYDAGPDFLNALIRLDSQLVRGDVEIHPIAGDWYAHGHHRDARYNNVILHLVTLDCPPAFRTIRANGTCVPTLNLDEFLEKSAEELELETEVSSPSETQCTLSLQDEETVRGVVEKSGNQRFRIKSSRFSERRASESWDQLMYQALFESLGYSKNQIPFRQLAAALPVERLWSFIWNDPPETAQQKCEAYLFGTAGLLPSQRREKDELRSPQTRAYIDLLETLWNHFSLRTKLDVQKPEAWQFFRLRPVNFPTRRIAAAAALTYRFMNDGFIGTFEKIVLDASLFPNRITSELEAVLTLSDEQFWSTHFDFYDPETNIIKALPVLGKERARDMVINVVLPALNAYGHEANDERLINAVLSIYARYPLASSNDITRKMCQRLFAKSSMPALINGARMQQGLLHLYKQVCNSGCVCRTCLDAFK